MISYKCIIKKLGLRSVHYICQKSIRVQVIFFPLGLVSNIFFLSLHIFIFYLFLFLKSELLESFEINFLKLVNSNVVLYINLSSNHKIKCVSIKFIVQNRYIECVALNNIIFLILFNSVIEEDGVRETNPSFVIISSTAFWIQNLLKNNIILFLFNGRFSKCVLSQTDLAYCIYLMMAFLLSR